MHSALIDRIESARDFLTPKEVLLADYILEHADEVLSMPISVLAKKSGVSEATIVRFARSMELKGFSEMKLALAAATAPAQNQVELANIKKDDTPGEIYRKTAEFAVKSIRNTEKLLDEGELERAADAIYQACRDGNRVYACGSGASGILVEEFQLKMMRLGIEVVYYKDAHVQMESFLNNIHQSDVLVAFTALGRSTETLQCIDIARRKGAKVIVGTQYGNQDVVKKADIALQTACIENDKRLISATVLITLSTVIDALFFSLAVKDYEKIEKDVADTRKEFKELGLADS